MPRIIRYQPPRALPTEYDELPDAFIAAQVVRHEGAPRNVPKPALERLRTWFTPPVIEVLDDGWFWFATKELRFIECEDRDLILQALEVLERMAQDDGTKLQGQPFTLDQSNWFIFDL